MSDCPGCFEQQRKINEKYKQVKKDAQKLANEINHGVAIFVKEGTWDYAKYCSSTITEPISEVINPM